MPLPFPSRAFRRQRERASGQLFALGIEDGTLETLTGQTVTLTRTTGRTVFDSAGRVATLVSGQAPFSAQYNATPGLWEPELAISMARTNRCLRSEDFGTTWAATGTPTRTAAAKTCGDLVLDLLGDDAAGTLEFYSQTVPFTGNAVKAISVFMAEGTSAGTVIRLNDGTAGVDRLLARVSWSAGAPSVVMTTGTYIGAVPCYGGVYRLLFQTTSVTAANTHALNIFPATTAALAIANTGTVYIGGVQVEDFRFPRDYVKTLGAAATHNADELATTFGFLPQDLTVYVRVRRPSWGSMAGDLGQYFGIYSFGNGATSSIAAVFDQGTRTVRPYVYDAAGTADAVSAALPASGVFEFAAQYRNFATAPAVRVDVGSGFGSWSVATLVPFSSFSAGARFGQRVTGEHLEAGLRRLVVSPGLKTLAEMQGPQP